MYVLMQILRYRLDNIYSQIHICGNMFAVYAYTHNCECIDHTYRFVHKHAFNIYS